MKCNLMTCKRKVAVLEDPVSDDVCDYCGNEYVDEKQISCDGDSDIVSFYRRCPLGHTWVVVSDKRIKMDTR